MIKSTTDYDMFKKYGPNRPISASHATMLMQSISIKNMLHLRPMIVNEHMEVIDGQHRLAAAKKLSFPIYYTIEKGSEDLDIILFNANVKAWGLADYYNHYVQRKFPEYMKLSDFLEKNDMLLRDYLRFNRVGSSDTTRFKKGNFIMAKDDMQASFLSIAHTTKELLSFISDRRSDILSILKTVTFRKGLMFFLRRDDINLDEFKTKLEYRMDLVGGRSGSGGYYLMFVDIYNYKRRDPILA